MDSLRVVVSTVIAVTALLVWLDARCLTDLARTGDGEPRHVIRDVWAR